MSFSAIISLSWADILEDETVCVCWCVEGRVDSSSNVFLENLHSAKNLVTVYYVTDVNQLTDFAWFRDSGIRVNVGLQGINLMPIYEDVSHQSDNSFMLQTPNSDQKAKQFSNILDRHCRYVEIKLLGIHLLLYYFCGKL